MKKIRLISALILIAALTAVSCGRKTPAGPENNTPTPTFTNTQIIIAGTATITMTRTPVVSPSSTVTASATQTNTPVPTQTFTGTATPSFTVTATLYFSVTNTATCTDTSTATSTKTGTQVLSPTISGTATPSATVTQTPTTIPTFADYALLIDVPAGTYIQSTGFEHTVSAFRICKFETTYNVWYTVRVWAVSNGYVFANLGREGHDGTIGAAPTATKHEPVTTINWRDAIVWCNAYSQMSGLTPVYCSDAALTTTVKNASDGAFGSSINTAAGSVDNPYVNWAANGYRLPTEGEWEYAARWKGTDSSNGALEYPASSGNYWSPSNYASGATAANDAATGLVAWYGGTTTHDDGLKAQNSLGLHDMCGNAWEWTWDWYAAYPASATDYRGPAIGSDHVRRGGCYYDSIASMPASYRATYGPPYWELNNTGFRFVRTY